MTTIWLDQFAGFPEVCHSGSGHFVPHVGKRFGATISSAELSSYSYKYGKHLNALNAKILNALNAIILFN